MNILILNDTSKYHNGSLQVICFLKNHFKNHNVILSKKAREEYLKNIDLLIINGEGSMHHNAKKANAMINLAMIAKEKYKIRTMLVNSVWQHNSDNLTSQLRYFDYIGVREILSKLEIKKVIDVNINLHLDLSFYIDVPYEKYPIANIVSGNFYVDGKNSQLIHGIDEDSSIDIFNESWNTIVNKLRHSKILVTGRHHEMYAACKARCPFIVLDGNTHKNSGLFKTFDVNIPVLPHDSSIKEMKKAIATIDQYRYEYIKLFDKMESYPQPNFL